MIKKNILIIIGLFLLNNFQIFAQWSPIVEITSGEYNDEIPVSASLYWPIDTFDFLAFVRTDTIGTNICVKKTTNNGNQWENLTTYITQDSFINTNPSIARSGSYGFNEKTVLVWQSNQSGNYDIYYSTFENNNWSQPLPVNTDISNDVNPSVAVIDTNFILVWESEGRIKSSIFQNRAWSVPVFITHQDSMNNIKPIISSGPSYNLFYVTFWEKKMGKNHHLYYSVFKNAAWTSPAVFSESGNNRNASITKNADRWGFIQVFWEKEINGNIEIFSKYTYSYNNPPSWSTEFNVSSDTSNHNKHPSSIFIPIITQNRELVAYYDALVYQDSSSYGDKIHLQWYFGLYHDTLYTNGADKNPVLTPGVWFGSGYNTWAVWQTDKTGKNQLVGSRINIIFPGVKEADQVNSFRLFQNYPNPFNQSTTISYSISKPTDIKLDIFNILGIKVKSFAEEFYDIGSYNISWDGTDDAGKILPSGIYYYSLKGNGFVQNRKMVLLR